MGGEGGGEEGEEGGEGGGVPPKQASDPPESMILIIQSKLMKLKLEPTNELISLICTGCAGTHKGSYSFGV